MGYGSDGDDDMALIMALVWSIDMGYGGDQDVSTVYRGDQDAGMTVIRVLVW